MLRRRPIRKTGKKKVVESRVDPWAEGMLNAFWNYVESDMANPSGVMKRMKALAAMTGKKTCSRYHHNRLAKAVKIKDTKCLICSSLATVRHHLIPLSAGGANARLNYAMLCDEHHEELHPHLARKHHP